MKCVIHYPFPLGGSDYNSTPAVLLFKSNSSTAIVSVQILDDNIVEERIESFIVEVLSILDYRGISFDNNSTRINIIDDDGKYTIVLVHFKLAQPIITACIDWLKGHMTSY